MLGLLPCLYLLVAKCNYSDLQSLRSNGETEIRRVSAARIPSNEDWSERECSG